MTCTEARQHWMLYLDSEGDPDLHLRINDHLGGCPACAEWFTKQGWLERALAEKLRGDGADPALWARVLSGSGLPPGQSRRRWRKPTLVLAGVAVAVGLAVAIPYVLPSRPPARPNEPVTLTRLTVDCHERHLRGTSRVEFLTRDGPEAERYVRGQVDFPVHAPKPAGLAFAVEGAGVCRWSPKPMVYFAGRLDQTSVSVFVLSRESLDAFPSERDRLLQSGGRWRDRESGYETVCGLKGDCVVMLVGTTPPESLDRLFDAYGAR